MIKYRAVIFDLDGTLCDTIADIAASVNLTMSAMGFPERSVEHTALGMNRGSRNLIAHALPEGADDGVVDGALSLYKEIYAEHLCDTTAPYPGMAELVKTLRLRGVKTAVLSNKPDAHVKRLVGHCFPGMFDEVVGQGRYQIKPSPEGPLAVAGLLGVSPKETLFVGDSDVDVMTARNAGMVSVGVTWGYRTPDVIARAGADFIVGTPEEIIGIISA